MFILVILLLNSEFFIWHILSFPVFAEFFISFSISKKPKTKLCQLNPLSMSPMNVILFVRFWIFRFRGGGRLVFGLMACFIIFDGMLDIEIRNILEITWSPGYFFLPPEKICFWHVVKLEADHFNPVRDLADSRLDFAHCKADMLFTFPAQAQAFKDSNRKPGCLQGPLYPGGPWAPTFIISSMRL